MGVAYLQVQLSRRGSHFSGCGLFEDAALMATAGKVKRRESFYLEENQSKYSLCLIRPKYVREEQVCSCRLSR